MRRNALLMAVATIGAIGCAKLATSSGATFVGSLSLCISLLSFAVPVAVLVARWQRHGFIDLLHPLVYMPLSFGLFFGSGASVLLRENRPEDADLVVRVLLLGLVGYCLGVAFARSARLGLREPSSPARCIVSRAAILCTFFVGALFMGVYWAAAGSIPLLAPDVESARLAALSGAGIPFQLSMLMMVAVWVAFGTENDLSAVSRSVLLGLGFVLLASSGWRNTPLALVAVTLLIVHYRKGIPARRLIAASVATVVLAVSIGLYREQSSSLSSYRTYRLVAEGQYLSAFSAYLESYSATFTRNLATVFEVVPTTLPFQRGETFIWNFVALLPGQEREPFDFVLKAAAGQGFAGGGLPPTMMGEFYVNFGWAGILLGMLLMGAVATLLHVQLRASSDLRRLLCLIALYYLFSAVRGGAGNVSLTLAWLVLSTAIIVRLTSRSALDQHDRQPRLEDAR